MVVSLALARPAAADDAGHRFTLGGMLGVDARDPDVMLRAELSYGMDYFYVAGGASSTSTSRYGYAEAGLSFLVATGVGVGSRDGELDGHFYLGIPLPFGFRNLPDDLSSFPFFEPYYRASFGLNDTPAIHEVGVALKWFFCISDSCEPLRDMKMSF